MHFLYSHIIFVLNFFVNYTIRKAENERYVEKHISWIGSGLGFRQQQPE